LLAGKGRANRGGDFANKNRTGEYRGRGLCGIVRPMPYNDPDPMKDVARMLVNKALRKGKITRPDHCTNCLYIDKPQAHHKDYENPGLIVWLCTGCHTDLHRGKITIAEDLYIQAF